MNPQAILPWSFFRSQFLAQDDGQLVGLTLKRDRWKSWWDGKYEPKTWSFGSLSLLTLMAPKCRNWSLEYNDSTWTYLLNKFMSSVTGLPKEEIIICAYYPVSLLLSNMKLFNWSTPDNCMMARPLRLWETPRGYLPPLWFHSFCESHYMYSYTTNNTFDTGRLSCVIADLLFIESDFKLDQNLHLNVTLLYSQRKSKFDSYADMDDEWDDDLALKTEYELSLDKAILLDSTKLGKFLYAIPWQSTEGTFETRRDVKIYLRKLFKWFDSRRLDKPDFKPCPGIVLFEPCISYIAKISYENPSNGLILSLNCLGIDSDDEDLMEFIFQ